MPTVNQTNVLSARKGCPLCGGAIKIQATGEPYGDPFLSGSYEGRYWCNPCWVLYWYEHPQFLVDEASRRQIAEEAKLILIDRKGVEVLFQEGKNRVSLTDRGTLLFEIKAQGDCISEEYDPERFQILIRALQAVDLKEIEGYQFTAKSA